MCVSDTSTEQGQEHGGGQVSAEGKDDTQEYGTTAQEWRSSVLTAQGQGKGLLPNRGLLGTEDR